MTASGCSPARSPRLAGKVADAVTAAVAAQDVTVPAEAVTGRVIADLAAFAALRDPESKAYYDRTRAEGKKHNAALICLARRRCNVILAMLRDRKPYQPRKPIPSLADAA